MLPEVVDGLLCCHGVTVNTLLPLLKVRKQQPGVTQGIPVLSIPDAI
jgi:hypothetical protein